MKTKIHPPIQLNAIHNRSTFILGLAFAFVTVLPQANAVTPAPDGGYAGNNTAEGTNALFSRTTGVYDTALGYYALYSDTTGSFNTATGANALRLNTSGVENTATGVYALYHNTSGSYNTVTGYQALFFNTTGFSNTATGLHALYANTTGSYNTATGLSALFHNTDGESNTASGVQALFKNTIGVSNTANGTIALLNNTSGSSNTAIGDGALANNTTGNSNTAIGADALRNNTSGGSSGGNLALGATAGYFLTTGSNNIDIANNGVAGESATIRIGATVHTRTFVAGIRGRTTGNANAVPVVIDSAGQLGTVSSSRRFKDEIRPMDSASESVLALKPVTFHYKSDSKATPQFGLIAEDVAAVNPDLVVRDENGEIYTVRYDAVNAMLLNEFLKQHRKVEEQDRRAQEQDARISQQQKDITMLTAALKEQAAQIQKVSTELALSKTAPQVVANNP